MADPAVDRAHAAAFGGRVCGVDEVGRGPWAGPVVVAAVVFQDGAAIPAVTDSKLLSEARREALFEEILEAAFVSVAVAPPRLIDSLNIRRATLEAMARAVAGVADAARGVLVDGRDVPPGLRLPAVALVGGDRLSPAIAAASIVAKVTRDRMMVRLAERVAGYGFERHKGYGTPEHAAALAALGPCEHHRRSFAPVRLQLGLFDIAAEVAG